MSDRSALEVEVAAEQWKRFCEATDMPEKSWEEVQPGRGGLTVLAHVNDVPGGGVDEIQAAINDGCRFLATHSRCYAYDAALSACFDGEGFSVWVIPGTDDDTIPAVRWRHTGPIDSDLEDATLYWQIVAAFDKAYPHPEKKEV